MAINDPFPVTEMLTSGQVMKIMGMPRSTWAEYLANNPQFPKSRIIGKTKAGNEIRRWRKSEVYAFITMLDA